MFFPLIKRSLAIVAFLSFVSFGQDSQDSSSIKIVPFGHSSMEWGQVVKGHDAFVGDISHVSFERIYLGSGMNVSLGENTKFVGCLDVKAFNEFPRRLNPGATRRFYYYFYLDQAELSHTLYNQGGLQIKVGGGYFKEKYNDNVRNLGEYLFRSTAYPQTLTTEFDFPLARLAGFYAHSSYVSGANTANLDVIANFNTEWMAIGDLNLTLISSYNYAHLFEIGAGVQFGSIISADESATTPKNLHTQYLNGTDTSGYYTFRGTKVMAQSSFDPKKLLPENTLLGEQDLKIYSEAAILGVKNYGIALYTPVWYNNILERIPVMLGFNFPAFKILDVLSLEGEWWGNPYPNSMEGIVIEGLPLPFPSTTPSVDSALYKNDNFKWSIFGEKTFARRYRISFQAACDHMRTFAWDYDRQDWEESLRGYKNWSYVFKFGVLF